MAADYSATQSWRDLCIETKMWNLTIRIKKNDEVDGKGLQTLIMVCLMKPHIEGAKVWTGVKGFGKRGKSTLHIEGYR